ncbi:hypothetical protein BaRGS_00022906 [Batillaria attramentaria]|uniref:Transmembrane protein n=1 Tax=Batillaria attramentaria TaxID=370345 RepID=A0ABD0KFS9_9CAEN
MNINAALADPSYRNCDKFVARPAATAGCGSVSALPTTLTVTDGESGQGADDVSSVERKRDGVEEERCRFPPSSADLILLAIPIVVTIVCCCVDFRIPRTRQEIDEAYKKRRMNEKYLYQLERTPDVVLRQNASSRQLQDEGLNRPTSAHQSTQDLARLADARAAPAASSSNHHGANTSHHQQRRHNDPSTGRSHAERPTAASGAPADNPARLAKIAKSRMYGVQTPFALSAMELMKQQRQRPTPRARQQE